MHGYCISWLCLPQISLPALSRALLSCLLLNFMFMFNNLKKIYCVPVVLVICMWGHSWLMKTLPAAILLNKSNYLLRRHQLLLGRCGAYSALLASLVCFIAWFSSSYDLFTYLFCHTHQNDFYLHQYLTSVICMCLQSPLSLLRSHSASAPGEVGQSLGSSSESYLTASHQLAHMGFENLFQC